MDENLCSNKDLLARIITQELGRGSGGAAYWLDDKTAIKIVVLEKSIQERDLDEVLILERIHNNIIVPQKEGYQHIINQYRWFTCQITDKKMIELLNEDSSENIIVICSVMERLDGTVKDLLKKGNFTDNKFLDMLRQIASGLRALAAEKIEYRDFHTDNIGYLGNTYKMIDFGFTGYYPQISSASLELLFINHLLAEFQEGKISPLLPRYLLAGAINLTELITICDQLLAGVIVHPTNIPDVKRYVQALISNDVKLADKSILRSFVVHENQVFVYSRGSWYNISVPGNDPASIVGAFAIPERSIRDLEDKLTDKVDEIDIMRDAKLRNTLLDGISNAWFINLIYQTVPSSLQFLIAFNGGNRLMSDAYAAIGIKLGMGGKLAPPQRVTIVKINDYANLLDKRIDSLLLSSTEYKDIDRQLSEWQPYETRCSSGSVQCQHLRYVAYNLLYFYSVLLVHLFIRDYRRNRKLIDNLLTVVDSISTDQSTGTGQSEQLVMLRGAMRATFLLPYSSINLHPIKRIGLLRKRANDDTILHRYFNILCMLNLELAGLEMLFNKTSSGIYQRMIGGYQSYTDELRAYSHQSNTLLIYATATEQG